MKTKSWSKIAREYSDKFVSEYLSKETEEEKIEYRRWLFGELLNPYRDGKFIGYWRDPIIQQRIVKRWKRKLDK